MNFVTWGASPWGEPVIFHAAWHWLWFSLAAGMAFAVVHALWVRLHRKDLAKPAVSPETAAKVPERILRHSLPARLFHWIMAAAMLTLPATAFLPKIGLRFDWVGLHVLAGMVLIAAIAFHIVHVLFFQDFRAIWPAPADWAEVRGYVTQTSPGDTEQRPGKYPLANKLYHLVIMVLGFTMAVTGAFMMTRVRTPMMVRDPYRFFTDADWGLVYALHGLAGLSMVALVIVHVYFALRPEKRPVTLSMIVGTYDRDYFLSHHDIARWSGVARSAE